MGFEPINDDHAIDSVVFSCALSEIVETQSLQALIGVLAEFEDELPAISGAKSFNNECQVSPERAPYLGFEAARFRANGSAIWVVRVVGSEITVECSRYTRWIKIWNKARGYIEAFVSIIAVHQPLIEVRFVTHQVKDVFKSEAGYAINRLLKDRTFLRLPALQAGDLWHVHQGWFSEAEDHAVLNRLNLESMPKSNRLGIEEVGMRQINIVHMQSHRPKIAWKALEFLPVLDDVVTSLHVGNKVWLGKLLQSAILERIGLKV